MYNRSLQRFPHIMTGYVIGKVLGVWGSSLLHHEEHDSILRGVTMVGLNVFTKSDMFTAP